MSSKTLARSRFAAAVVAVTGIGLVGVQAPAQAAHGQYWTHLKCTIGAGTLIQMDVSMKPPQPGSNLWPVTRVDYSTVQPFRADKVQLMLSYFGTSDYQTFATWGDGSAGSVNTSFGSLAGAGTGLNLGKDKLKMKVASGGTVVTCITTVGGGHA